MILASQAIVQYFMQYKPDRYSISKITCVLNRSLKAGFEAHLVGTDDEKRKLLFRTGRMSRCLKGGKLS